MLKLPSAGTHIKYLRLYLPYMPGNLEAVESWSRAKKSEMRKDFFIFEGKLFIIHDWPESSII
jgi:hypothetical protein